MLGNISTHAPLAGRDCCRISTGGADDISTHAPLAGRDVSTYLYIAEALFQPTRPLRGATWQGGAMQTIPSDFNPRAPCGARPLGLCWQARLCWISTHAPLAGRDSRHSIGTPKSSLFQPTRPLRGATPLFPQPQKTNRKNFNPRAPCGARQQKSTNHYAHFCDNRQISDAFAQNAACQGILLLFDAGKPCGFWVRTAQVISAHLCFAL